MASVRLGSSWREEAALDREGTDRRSDDETACALRKGESLGVRLARVGFDWADVAGPRAKVDEELGELDEAVARGDRESIDHELGDVLFAVVNVARHLGVDVESSLHRALGRVESRFSEVERRLEAQGRTPRDCDIEELEALWQAAKVDARDPLGEGDASLQNGWDTSQS